KNEAVLVGVETADDAGVYHLSDDINLVQTADFITPPVDDPFLYGRIAAANSLSDVYAMGGRPLTALNLCCFPPAGVDKEHLTEILRGGLEAIKEAGAALVGGHTVKDEELKYGLSVTGIVRKADIKRNSTAKVGDKLILTKPIGTGVIVGGTKRGLLPPDGVIRRAAAHMATLNATASKQMVEFGASACTDVTGFGLAGHAFEMAKGSGVGIRFWAGKVPHYPESLEMIRQGVRTGLTQPNFHSVEGHFKPDATLPQELVGLFFDPQTSGGLLISIAAEKASALLDVLHKDGIKEAEIIGEVFAAAGPQIVIER
ncbi:MAG: selenide, water dikinase SelD, partial [candidate division Zixibacteria bacterium]|nr:selenide, water dikinase SelD [candidate division Zixibacteria bacterium]